MDSFGGNGEEDFSSCSTDEASFENEPWIPWYCSLKGNEFLCEVEAEFVEDDFNLTGLSNAVPHYEYALDLILDAEETEFGLFSSPIHMVPHCRQLDSFSETQRDLIQNSAEQLYGLIHARFIITPPGLELMVWLFCPGRYCVNCFQRDKYLQGVFGRCPRQYCQEQLCLPIGEHDTLHRSTVRLYCPKCEELYYPASHRYQNLDGAFFGTTFPHLFFQQFPELIPPKPTARFIPKIFGFRIHKSAGIPGAGIGSRAGLLPTAVAPPPAISSSTAAAETAKSVAAFPALKGLFSLCSARSVSPTPPAAPTKNVPSSPEGQAEEPVGRRARAHRAHHTPDATHQADGNVEDEEASEGEEPDNEDAAGKAEGNDGRKASARNKSRNS